MLLGLLENSLAMLSMAAEIMTAMARNLLEPKS